MPDFTNLDPQIVSLAKAIRQVESGGDFNAIGDQGSSKGAYQFHNDHFEQWAKQFGLDPSDFSPVNQDKVAYAKIKAWKDQGYHAGEIAALWNGAHMENGRPIANHPDYVTKVQKALGGGTAPAGNPSPAASGGYNPKPFSSGAVKLPEPIVNQNNPPVGQNGQHGFLADPSLKKYSDNPLVNGVAQAGEQIANSTIGAGKSIANTVDAFSGLGQKALQGVSSTLFPGAIDKGSQQVAKLPSQVTTPTKAQQPGFVGGQIGQALGGAESALGAVGESLPKLAGQALSKGKSLLTLPNLAKGYLVDKLVTNPHAKGIIHSLLTHIGL